MKNLVIGTISCIVALGIGIYNKKNKFAFLAICLYTINTKCGCFINRSTSRGQAPAIGKKGKCR